MRWAGSKKVLKPEILKYFPKSYNNYHEPFLGSGAIFFALNRMHNCFISDTNGELINSYLQIKNNASAVVTILKTYENNVDFFYKIRELIPQSDTEAAARFIYLNRTCYNGLFRVNSLGNFNVPFGRRARVDIVTEELLLNVSSVLQNIEIHLCDFQETLGNMGKSDMVFLDPPYVTSHNTNGFIEYNQKIFNWDDQLRLHSYVKDLISKECYFILTNAAHSSLKELYSDICDPIILERHSCIGGKNSYRGTVQEYLFTNIPR